MTDTSTTKTDAESRMLRVQSGSYIVRIVDKGEKRMLMLVPKTLPTPNVAYLSLLPVELVAI